MSYITQAMGKRAQSLKWVVSPPTSIKAVLRLVALAERRVEPVYIRVRPDIDKMGRKHSERVGAYVHQLKRDGRIEAPVEKLFDDETRRMVHTNATVKEGEILAVNPLHACTLLNPEKFGMLFEECDAQGVPVAPCTPGGDVAKPTAPPKPGGSSIQGELAKMQAEIEALRRERDEALAAAAAPPKPKRKRKPRAKKPAAEPAPDTEN